MGRHLAVAANSFARKWFVPVGWANEFAPTTEDACAVCDGRIVHALHAQLRQVIATQAASCKRIVATLSQQLLPARARLAQRKGDGELGV